MLYLRLSRNTQRFSKPSSGVIPKARAEPCKLTSKRICGATPMQTKTRANGKQRRMEAGPTARQERRNQRRANFRFTALQLPPANWRPNKFAPNLYDETSASIFMSLQHRGDCVSCGEFRNPCPASESIFPFNS